MIAKNKKLKKVKVECPACGKKFEAEKSTWFSRAKCVRCDHIFPVEEGSERVIYYKKYKDLTALGYDRKTGKHVAIDTKGNRVDPKDTRYNLRSDPKGWKAIGKKVRRFDRKGVPYSPDDL